MIGGARWGGDRWSEMGEGARRSEMGGGGLIAGERGERRRPKASERGIPTEKGVERSNKSLRINQLSYYFLGLPR